VSELGTEAAGGSIARSGSGNTNTWQVVTDDTPGQLNAGQTFLPAPTADFVNLQFPSSTTILTGGTTETIYGRIFEAGLTEAAGAPSNVIVQLGYGPAGSDPTTSPDWVWVNATYNVQVGNDDEYMATLTVPDAGTYAYTFRFGIDDGLHPVVYTYADLDGAGTNPGLSFDPNQLGALTVNWEIIDGTESPDTINGDGNAEIINGLGGNDQINGGGGHDRIFGGAGNDTIFGGGADQVWVEGGAGDDFISAFGTVSYENASGAVQVNLKTGTATGADGHDTISDATNVVGSAFNDTLTGSDSVDSVETLEGRAGNDTLDGGEGPNQLDGGDGVDTVTYANATSGMTVFFGASGFAFGSDSRTDTLISIENVIGSAFNDMLGGDGGNNDINGGAGADDMTGGDGNDRYWVDDVGDSVTENPGEGTDEVRSTINCTLAANVENLTLLGSANINGTGNGSSNIITGNAGANVLDGLAGADTMRGGNGNDTYYVDNAGDKANESSAAGGVDTVRSSVTFTLGTNVENLILTGSANINGNGNAIANSLTGNSGANLLNGGAGADTMRGGDGNDTYYVDNAGDKAIESSALGGVDTVRSSVTFTLGANVENLVLTAGAADGTGNVLANRITGNETGNALRGLDGNDILTGNGGDDSLYGGTGNDQLNGGAGADWLEGGIGQDQLTGGTGLDTFMFRDGDFAGLTSGTADRIHDFSHSDGDKIRLVAIDANSANGSGTNEAFSFIGTSAFHNVAGELRYEQISGNTFVYGDTNGDGTADFMIRVDGIQAFVASDFTL
jgi:Ca2+-binding RTX toxin-like protein